MVTRSGMQASLELAYTAHQEGATLHVFHLIDLWSQAHYIPREVRRPHERFLAWLRLYGDVTESSFQIGENTITQYWFASPYWTGRTAFLYDDDTGLRFPGTHFIWRDDLTEG